VEDLASLFPVNLPFPFGSLSSRQQDIFTDKTDLTEAVNIRQELEDKSKGGETMPRISEADYLQQESRSNPNNLASIMQSALNISS